MKPRQGLGGVLLTALVLLAGCTAGPDGKGTDDFEAAIGVSADAWPPVTEWDTWHQFRGSASRAGHAAVPAGPLDVVRAGTLLPEGNWTSEFASLDVVPTPYGLTTYHGGNPTQQCTIQLLSDLDPDAQSWHQAMACWGVVGARNREAMVVAVDTDAGRAFTCNRGGTGFDTEPPFVAVPIPLIRAWDLASQALIWEVKVDDLLGEPAATTAETHQTALDCTAGIYDADGDRIYVAVHDTRPDGTSNLVAVIRASSGQVVDRMPLPPFAEPGLSGGLTSTEARPPMRPLSLTMTSTGFVVLGYVSTRVLEGPLASSEQDPVRYEQATSAVAWYAADGSFRGWQTYGSLDTPVRQSEAATSHGATAAFATASGVLFLDPGSSNPPFSVPPQTTEDLQNQANAQWTAPAWWRDTVVIPFQTSITSYRPRIADPVWVWAPVEEAHVVDILIAPPNRLFVLAVGADATSEPAPADGPADGKRLFLAELGLSDGVERHRIPLNMQAPPTGDLGGHRGTILPIAEHGLLVTNRYGEYALVSHRDAASAAWAEPQDAYATDGKAILQLTPPPEADIQTIAISWGDGATTFAAPGTTAVTHDYTRKPDLAGRATFVLADGRTVTEPFAFRVGEERPPSKTFLETAFSADNQEATFFLMGIALTSAAGGYAMTRRHHRRSRVGLRIDELDAIRRAGRDDPAAALVSMAAFRARLRNDWKRGRLDESGFLAVDSRAGIGTRLLTEFLGDDLDGSPRDEFVELFHSALEDGDLSSRELARLETAMRAESELTALDRRRLRRLFTDLVASSEHARKE